jgi:hypothetical protein
MSAPPGAPKIYHIVHFDKLVSIIAAGGLFVIQRTPIAGTTIGMGDLKRDRLTLPVHCHVGCMVGDFVPFYFCPRSLMLYVISKANHPQLAYRGGQRHIVHLEADLHDAVKWAQQMGHKWAFTTSNATARYTQFHNDINNLSFIDWDSVRANNWAASHVREGKQAEFLVQESFPWQLVQRIRVYSQGVYTQVQAILASAPHKPRLEIKQDWYY